MIISIVKMLGKLGSITIHIVHTREWPPNRIFLHSLACWHIANLWQKLCGYFLNKNHNNLLRWAVAKVKKRVKTGVQPSQTFATAAISKCCVLTQKKYSSLKCIVKFWVPIKCEWGGVYAFQWKNELVLCTFNLLRTSKNIENCSVLRSLSSFSFIRPCWENTLIHRS